MLTLSFDIGQYLIWQYLLGIGIFCISAYASYRHKVATPIFWGLSVSLLVIMLAKYLAPILFGVLLYDWATQFWLWFIMGAFGVMWFGYIALTLWNLVDKGEVVL